MSRFIRDVLCKRISRLIEQDKNISDSWRKKFAKVLFFSLIKNYFYVYEMYYFVY